VVEDIVVAPAEAEDIVVVEVVAEVAINQSQKLPGDFVEVQNGRVVFFMEKCMHVVPPMRQCALCLTSQRGAIHK
jgi:hypothetical protein